MSVKIELNAVDIAVLTANALELYLQLLKTHAEEAGKEYITHEDIEKHSFERNPALVKKLQQIALKLETKE